MKKSLILDTLDKKFISVINLDNIIDLKSIRTNNSQNDIPPSTMTTKNEKKLKYGDRNAWFIGATSRNQFDIEPFDS